MKRLKIILLFLCINVAVNGQSFYCTKTISQENCKLNFTNNALTKWAQLDLKTTTWSVDQIGSIVIKDGNTQVTIKNDGCLTSPTFVALKDSLNSWQSQCVGSGGTVIPIPLILDTLKGLVYTASAKVRTNRDTLYNCKSISFGRKSTASGTLILTFENGESESFNVENDDLPAWVNGEFISYLDYNATGAVGLIVNTLGCSQTDTEICAKVKPIFDCDLVIPITCLGWQSASGVWQTLSGCWNTGQ
jgi:hypothetical protein